MVPNKDTNIKDYIERFFNEKTTDKAWDLVRELKDQFGLNCAEAYRYVSAYLSKKWAADEELLEDLRLEQLEQMG